MCFIRTYPTSYVQYLAFGGGLDFVTTDSYYSQVYCASTVSAVTLPATTDPSQFIFPLGSTELTGPLISVPTALLTYLDGLSTVSVQFSGTPLTRCTPSDIIHTYTVPTTGITATSSAVSLLSALGVSTSLGSQAISASSTGGVVVASGASESTGQTSYASSSAYPTQEEGTTEMVLGVSTASMSVMGTEAVSHATASVLFNYTAPPTTVTEVTTKKRIGAIPLAGPQDSHAATPASWASSGSRFTAAGTSSATKLKTPLTNTASASGAHPVASGESIEVLWSFIEIIISSLKTSHSVLLHGAASTNSPYQGPQYSQPATAALTASLASIEIGNSTYTPDQGSIYHIDSQTLTPDGAITVGGTTVSLAESATAAVVNGVSETPLAPSTTSVQKTTLAPALTFGGSTYSAEYAISYMIAEKVLSPGGEVVESGTTISLGTADQYIVVNGQTSTLAAPPPSTLTVGSQVYAAVSGTPRLIYSIDSQTLTPGGDIVVNGTTLSLASLVAALVARTSTEVLRTPTASTTTSGGIGSYILSGLGGTATEAAATTASHTGPVSTGISGSAVMRKENVAFLASFAFAVTMSLSVLVL